MLAGLKMSSLVYKCEFYRLEHTEAHGTEF